MIREEKTVPRGRWKVGNSAYVLVCFVAISYFISIWVLNLTGRVWSNYDIYMDAILAKYMWQTKSLFPEGWYFGNQIYTVATPAIAALCYGIVKDAYLALALASCLMTCGIVASYCWCLRSFANLKSILISLLVVLGGTNIGFTAHGDWKGLQVFYTMASYYACYVIGIFITLGVFFRLLKRKRVHVVIQLGVLLYNLALGMQSLRELLVLNLPLCAVVVVDVMLHWKSLRKNLQEKWYSYTFVFLTLLVNVCGVFITKYLVTNGVIKQSTIISGVETNLWYNFKMSVREFLDYIGINLSVPVTALEWLELAAGIFSMIVVIATLGCVFIQWVKCKKLSELEYIVLFFVISLLAVFCAGIFVISLRNIYFFCWYFLVAVSVVRLMEVNAERCSEKINLAKNIFMGMLLVCSILNYRFTFYQSFSWLNGTNDMYQKIVEQLQEDNIRYIYSDWRTERNEIAAMSYDKIMYGTLEFSGKSEDLWRGTGCLYHEAWFEPSNFEQAYIVLSDYALYCLESEFSEEYRTTFMGNLEHVYSLPADGENLHFYKGSEKMYADMIQ